MKLKASVLPPDEWCEACNIKTGEPLIALISNTKEQGRVQIWAHFSCLERLIAKTKARADGDKK